MTREKERVNARYTFHWWCKHGWQCSIITHT